MSTIISYASIHSLERAKERAGLNEKKAEKRIQIALERGRTAETFTSKERDFLERESSDFCVAIAYANFCYIVNENGFCVTMYPLPKWFGKKKHFDGKEKIRNVKAYARNHRMDCYEYAY